MRVGNRVTQLGFDFGDQARLGEDVHPLRDGGMMLEACIPLGNHVLKLHALPLIGKESMPEPSVHSIVAWREITVSKAQLLQAPEPVEHLFDKRKIERLIPYIC